MYNARNSNERKASGRRTIRLSKSRLEALVDEATIDAYNEAEQAAGFFTMMEDNLRLPFETEMFGFKVTVERVDMTEDDAIVAICKRGSKRQTVSILDLPLPSPPPQGAEWIAAYKYWRRGIE
jgi:hypothetical protein